MKIDFKKIILAFVAVGFVGCDEGVDGVKRAFSSIKEPLISVEQSVKEFLNNYYIKSQLVIQSQDNNMIIEGMSINQGNCPVSLYTVDFESVKKALQIVPEMGVVRIDRGGLRSSVEVVPFLLDKNEEVYLIGDLKFGVNRYGLTGFGSKLLIWDNNTSLYDNAHDGIKEIVDVVFKPVYPVKLPFGEKFAPILGCDGSKIIEVSLKTNGGEMTFNIGGLR